jgi:hypothetical protein
VLVCQPVIDRLQACREFLFVGGENRLVIDVKYYVE